MVAGQEETLDEPPSDGSAAATGEEPQAPPEAAQPPDADLALRDLELSPERPPAARTAEQSAASEDPSSAERDEPDLSLSTRRLTAEDRKSTRPNSSHSCASRRPSSDYIKKQIYILTLIF